MQVTIVGLPGSGKTTVFNALTGGQAATGTFAGERAAPNLAVVKVPDERVERLATVFHPKKLVHSDVTYADVAIAEGAAREGTIAPEQLDLIRGADALLHVARAFDDPSQPRPADPWRDIEELDLEFAIADLAIVERRLERLTTSARHGSASEREAAAREEALLRRLQPHLAEGRPLREVTLEADQNAALRGFRFLTAKPVLVVLNIDEGRVTDQVAVEASGHGRYDHQNTDVAALAGKLESEIAQLPAEDAPAFRAELGVLEPGRDRVIRRTHELLGLITFLTGGEEECRAWPIRRGSTALDAAGMIHSDLARGFIRAEVVAFDELMEAGSMAEARHRGVLRSEGKGYEVRDGDVVHVLFNVAR
jgi:GTP-binding protein YchF